MTLPARAIKTKRRAMKNGAETTKIAIGNVDNFQKVPWKTCVLFQKVPWKMCANPQKVPWKMCANRQKVPWKTCVAIIITVTNPQSPKHNSANVSTLRLAAITDSFVRIGCTSRIKINKFILYSLRFALPLDKVGGVSTMQIRKNICFFFALSSTCTTFVTY